MIPYYGELNYLLLNWVVRGKKTSEYMRREYSSDIDFSTIDEESLLEIVCKEYSDIYQRLRKYAFVLTEKAMIDEDFKLDKVENIWESYQSCILRKRIERAMEKYNRIKDEDESGVILFGLLVCIYEDACHFSVSKEKLNRSVNRKMCIAITLAYLIREDKRELIETIFDFNIQESLGKVNIQRESLRNIEEQFIFEIERPYFR